MSGHPETTMDVPFILETRMRNWTYKGVIVVQVTYHGTLIGLSIGGMIFRSSFKLWLSFVFSVLGWWLVLIVREIVWPPAVSILLWWLYDRITSSIWAGIILSFGYYFEDNSDTFCLQVLLVLFHLEILSRKLCSNGRHWCSLWLSQALMVSQALFRNLLCIRLLVLAPLSIGLAS